MLVTGGQKLRAKVSSLTFLELALSECNNARKRAIHSSE